MKNFLLKVWRNEYTAVILMMVFFFILSSYLAFTNNGILNSPDETANYFFIDQFASRNQLSVPESANDISGIVFPRSTNLIGNSIVPTGFLGLPVYYGYLAKITCQPVVLFMTPLFAALSFLAFYWLVKQIFDRRVALIACVFWLGSAPLIYYTNRGLMPNVPFLSFVVCALFFLFKAYQTKAWYQYLLSGAFFAAALSIRLNEILWLLPLLVWLGYEMRQDWKRYGYFILGVMLAALPVLYWQRVTYGSLFTTGYTVLPGGEPSSGSIFQGPLAYFLPFGFHERAIVKNSWQFFVQLFWWAAVPAALGYAMLWRHWRQLSLFWKKYLIVGSVISLWLFVYYGSGKFNDSTLPSPTLGGSYVRYWLPITVWAFPLAAYAIKNRAWWLQGVILTIVSVLGINLAIFSTPESVIPISNTLESYQKIRQLIVSNTPDKAIIITCRTDKIFFPSRRVISFMPPDYSWTSKITKFLPQYPVYFYSLQAVNEVEDIANKVGAVFEPVLKYEKFTLYKINAKP